MAFNRKQMKPASPAFTSEMFPKKTLNIQALEHIQQFVYAMPGEYSTDQRQMMVRTFVNYFKENPNIITLLNQPAKLQEVCAELGEQLKHQMTSTATAKKSLFNVFSETIIGAKFASLFPGLGVLTMLIAPAAASSYQYVTGQPSGGEDLCAQALGDCIQGYLTELNKAWSSEMPQVARLFEATDPSAMPCISQNDMAAMMKRSYARPIVQPSECILTKSLENNRTVEVMAKGVDRITCNIMKDSLEGLGANCDHAPLLSKAEVLKIAGVTVGSLALLGLIVYTVCKCWGPKEKNSMDGYTSSYQSFA